MVTDLVVTSSRISTGETLLAGSILGGLLGVFALVVITFYVLLVIANWKIFEKAGEKGWKSLIPFYNLYILFKLFWETKYFWISLSVLLVCELASDLRVQDNNSVLLACASLAAGIAALVFFIILCNRMSKSFGHGAGFTVGLIFFPNIFTLILGFNKDKYKKIKD